METRLQTGRREGQRDRERLVRAVREWRGRGISRFDRGGRGLDPIAEGVREEVNGTLYGKGTGGYRGGWPSGSHPK